MHIYIKTGKYYGYPDCCIKSFCERNNYDYNQNKVHNSFGFIPCPKCAKRIINGEIKLNDLIKNRKCKTPFPIDDMDTLNLKYN